MIADMLPLYLVVAISVLTLLVSVGIAWEIRRVGSHVLRVHGHVLRILDGRLPGEPRPEVPVYPAFTPEDYKAQARAYWEERIRIEAIRRAAPPSRARRPDEWVACSTDGERVEEPVVRSPDEAGVFRAMPALGEDDDITEPSASTQRVKPRSEQ